MKVSLGTIEVDDTTRKAIRKDLGKSGHASRDDVKSYLHSVIEASLKNAGSGDVQRMTGAPDEPELPEPGSSDVGGTTTTPTTTAAGGTAPTTGNLGSAGTPGGTV